MGRSETGHKAFVVCREVTELLRAVRNVAGHWLPPRSPEGQPALGSLTGRSAEEIRGVQATEREATERAEAIGRFFVVVCDLELSGWAGADRQPHTHG